jgi:ABC-type transporter lipoprotein component MlaA
MVFITIFLAVTMTSRNNCTLSENSSSENEDDSEDYDPMKEFNKFIVSCACFQ